MSRIEIKVARVTKEYATGQGQYGQPEHEAEITIGNHVFCMEDADAARLTEMLVFCGFAKGQKAPYQ